MVHQPGQLSDSETQSVPVGELSFQLIVGPVWYRAAVLVVRVARSNPLTVGIVVGVVCLAGFMEGLNLSILLPLLSQIGVSSGTTPSGPARVIETMFSSVGVPLTLGVVLTLFTVVGSVQIGLRALQQILVARLTEKLTTSIRQRLFDSASRARWTVLLAGKGAHLTNTIVGEAARAGLVYGNIITSIGILVGFLVYIGLAAWISWWLTALICAMGILATVGLRGIYRSSHRFGRMTNAAMNRMQEVLSEHIGAAKLIRSLGAGRWSRSTFAAAVAGVEDYQLRNQVNSMLVLSSVEPLGLFLVVALIYASVSIAQLSPAELMILLVIIFRLTPRMVVLQEMLQRISGMLPAYEAVVDMLDGLGKGCEHHGTKQFAGLKEQIELRTVTVTHKQDGKVVLREVNVEIEKRKTVAFVGKSGGGKTTLLDLLSGVLIADFGHVAIDGVPLHELDLDTYRARLGVVPQEGFFFHDTIAANLRVANPAATDSELWDVLAAVAADGFVKEREGQLEALVGDQGGRLSGGQRQRLALARALLRKPDILLLDEPTSAMDHATELAIRETLKRLHGQMTIVLITHKLEMADDADVVYSVSDGQVRRIGSVAHSETGQRTQGK